MEIPDFSEPKIYNIDCKLDKACPYSIVAKTITSQKPNDYFFYTVEFSTYSADSSLIHPFITKFRIHNIFAYFSFATSVHGQIEDTKFLFNSNGSNEENYELLTLQIENIIININTFARTFDSIAIIPLESGLESQFGIQITSRGSEL